MEKGNDMMRFKDRVVLITGAVRGIGWEISRRFAGEGARVVINDIDEGIVRSRSQELNEQGFQALGIRADVSKGSEVEGMINEILDRFGNLDVLVNNAAVFYPSVPIVDIEEKEWDKVMAVNVKGALNSGLLTSRNFNCNLFRCEDQRHPGTGVDI